MSSSRRSPAARRSAFEKGFVLAVISSAVCASACAAILGIDDVHLDANDGSAPSDGAFGGDTTSDAALRGDAASDGGWCQQFASGAYLCADFDEGNSANGFIGGRGPQGIFSSATGGKSSFVELVGDASSSAVGERTDELLTPDAGAFAWLYTNGNGGIDEKIGSSFKVAYDVYLPESIAPSGEGLLQFAFFTLAPLDGGDGFTAGYELTPGGARLWAGAYAFSPDANIFSFPVSSLPVGTWSRLELDITLSDDGSGPSAHVVFFIGGIQQQVEDLPAVSATAVPHINLGLTASRFFTPQATVNYDNLTLEVDPDR
jgi:hypothetical protein